MKSLLARKSIRNYTSEKISGEIIHDLLHAAMSAPSAANQRPWHFVAIQDRKIIDTIPTFHPYASYISKAPLVIAVCASKNLGDFGHYWVQDCAAATQNILTAAVEKGLGGVWLGVYPAQNVKEVHELLNLPESIIPFSLVSLGYPLEQPTTGNRYDESRVHFDQW
jgi:nitroreductase